MKGKIKEAILEERNSLSKQEICFKSEIIKEVLFNHEVYKKSKTIMFFVSFKNEIYTHDMIKQALKQKVVVVPKIVHDDIKDSKEIYPSIIVDFDNLITNKIGILEPFEVKKISYESIDLVLVPGIVFDKRGHRIGFGLGYYDKFLKKVPKSIKVGLAFDFQVVDELPSESHDVAVEMIITDKRVIPTIPTKAYTQKYIF